MGWRLPSGGGNGFNEASVIYRGILARLATNRGRLTIRFNEASVIYRGIRGQPSGARAGSDLASMRPR